MLGYTSVYSSTYLLILWKTEKISVDSILWISKVLLQSDLILKCFCISHNCYLIYVSGAKYTEIIIFRLIFTILQANREHLKYVEQDFLINTYLQRNYSTKINFRVC